MSKAKADSYTTFVAAMQDASDAIEKVGYPVLVDGWPSGRLAPLAEEQFVPGISHDARDTAARAVIAGSLWARATTPRLIFNGEEDEVVEGPFPEVWPELRAYLDRIPVSEVSDPGLLTWEINAAGISGHMDRVFSLSEQLAAGRGHDPAVLTTCVLSLFLLAAPTSSHEDDWWEPRVNSLVDPEIMRLLVAHRIADSILKHSPGFRVSETSGQGSDRLSDVVLKSLSLRIAQLAKIGPLAELPRLVSTFVKFHQAQAAGDHGQFRAAAEEICAEVDALVAWSPKPKKALTQVLRGAAAAYFCGRDFVNAAHCLERASTIDPKDPTLWLEIAKCHHANEDPSATRVALERHIQVAQTDEFVAGLALSYGYENAILRKYFGDLENAIWEMPGRATREAFLGAIQPSYRGMSEGARHKWFAAVTLMGWSSPDEVPARWDNVCSLSRAAFEIELRVKFFHSAIRDEGVLSTVTDPKQSDAWEKVQGGTANLGGYLFLLSEDVLTSSSGMGFRYWLQQRRPRLLEPEEDLRRFWREASALKRAGNHGTHEIGEEAAARQAFRSARNLLEFLDWVVPPDERDGPG